ncbi:hypothetical protein IWZ00DRAFT_280009 [Phyllosticta capitalensis]|uniref:uncharacterized protein n=1 Tax=Phyllosticta capitalensis TaxID=121624 RepID=UPI003131CCA9
MERGREGWRRGRGSFTFRFCFYLERAVSRLLYIQQLFLCTSGFKNFRPHVVFMFGVRAYSCAASAMEAKSIQAIMTTDPSTGKQPERRRLVGVMIMFGIRAYSYVCCSRGDEGQVECGPPNRHATAEPALGKESRRGQSWASGNPWRRLFFLFKKSVHHRRTDGPVL